MIAISNTQINVLVCIIIATVVIWVLYYTLPYLVYVVVRMAALAFYRGKAEAQNYDKKNGVNNGAKEEKKSG